MARLCIAYGESKSSVGWSCVLMSFAELQTSLSTLLAFSLNIHRASRRVLRCDYSIHCHHRFRIPSPTTARLSLNPALAQRQE